MSDDSVSTAVPDADAIDDGGDSSPARDIDELRTIADYQFGAGAGTTLFPVAERFEVRRSSGGRPRQIHTEDARLVSYGVDGRFRLAIAGGRRLLDGLPAPANRVVVGDESEPFVRDGKNAFAKFVIEVDSEIRPGDEVLVVHERGDLLAVGRAELSADGMVDFDSGMAVKVREGVDD
jgi:uncharacterized protein with predicted RNA binding PUA domain